MTVSLTEKDRKLYWIMQCINLVSLPISLLLPTSSSFISSLQPFMSWKHDYLYSIRPFVPDLILSEIFHMSRPMPIQTIEIGEENNLYFPGVALECLFGTIQGVWLGIDLWKTPQSGNQKIPRIGALTMFAYAIMCISAFPLHCLKDVAMFDIDSHSTLTKALFWIDTLSTSIVSPFMFVAGLIECNMLPITTGIWITEWIVFPFCTFFSAIGVWWPNRWITCMLHVFFLWIWPVPLLIITYQRMKRLGVNKSLCPHGYFYMALAKLISIGGCDLSWFRGNELSELTGGRYCVLTSCFLASRVGMVQYWVYCKCQTVCFCSKTEKKE